MGLNQTAASRIEIPIMMTSKQPKSPSASRSKNDSSPTRPRTAETSPSSQSSTTNDGSSSHMNYSTIRRLSDDDVRAIFDCLHNHAPNPSHLDFSIVPVGPNGLKLSPPPYEFEAGLYVLLRPEKRPKQKSLHYVVPKAPRHLEHMLLRKQPQAACPWQLSGPQFPTPTVIQQRYCYPKGSPGYSSRIGGALWTMYGVDGKEDDEFRLLHVYYSAKRAINKGISLPFTVSESPTSKIKRSKRTPERRLDHSPAITNSSMSQTSISCSSPSQGYGAMVPPSAAQNYYHPYHQHFSPHHLHYGHHLYVTPTDQSGFINHNHRSSNKEVFRRFNHMDQNTPVRQYSQAINVESPLRRQRGPPIIRRMHHAPSDDSSEHQQSPPDIAKTVKSQDSYDSKSSLSAVEPFDLDTGSLKDIDSYWTDPLLSLLLKPSHDKSSTSSTSSLPTQSQRATDRSLMAKLETLQLSIRELILQAPDPDEQEVLLSMLTTWANELAKDPLSDPVLSTNRQPGERMDSNSINESSESG